MIKGLSSIKAKESKPTLVIDLSEIAGEEAKISFREPRASDLFPNPDATKTMRSYFPEFPDSMLYQCILMGKCYVFESEDAKGEQKPAVDFGNLARSNADVFFHILSRFLEAYQINDIEEKVKDSKNAIAE
jgi:hypothetical protein